MASAGSVAALDLTFTTFATTKAFTTKNTWRCCVVHVIDPFPVMKLII